MLIKTQKIILLMIFVLSHGIYGCQINTIGSSKSDRIIDDQQLPILFENFIKEQASLIAYVAHPENGNQQYHTNIEANIATINFTYTSENDSSSMQLKISINDTYLISDVQIAYDENIELAFSDQYAIEEMIEELRRDQSLQSSFQRAQFHTSRIVKKQYHEWTGIDNCLFILNTYWLNNGSYYAIAKNK